jgi:hypothetical protein
MTKKKAKTAVVEAEVVKAESKTQVSTIIETKVNRKELIDMVLDEQEAQIEDRLEQAEAKFLAADHDFTRTFKRMWDLDKNKELTTILMKNKIVKNLLKALEAAGHENLELRYRLSVKCRIHVDDHYLDTDSYCITTNQREIEAIKKSIKEDLHEVDFEVLSKQSGHNYTETLDIYLDKPFEFKIVKELIAEYKEKAQAFLKALEGVNKAKEQQRAFKKKGKRAKSKFVRELLQGSDEGQKILSQLDTIKKDTQKLLESE